MSKIVTFSAAPLSGKTYLNKFLSAELHGSSDRPWLLLDNEVSSFSKQARVACAKASGVKLNSAEFAKAFNLVFQLQYQASARYYADQNFNVVMPGPFEDLTSDVGGLPLYRHMKEKDFAGYEFHVVQLLIMPEGDAGITSENVIEHPAMIPIEAELQRRRERRGQGDSAQQQLDADKTHDTYYGERAQKMLRTKEMFDEITQICVGIRDTPKQIAQRVANAILEL